MTKTKGKKRKMHISKRLKHQSLNDLQREL